MQGKEEEDKVKYNCLTNESMVFEREGRSICSFGGKKYIFSSNNHQDLSDMLLEAEYAVFSGNLLRYILGPQQPQYYLASNAMGTKYYRVSDKLENYSDWCDVVRETGTDAISFQWDDNEDEDILDVNIVGLVDLFVVCHFLGEADWEGGNFGFVKDGNTFNAVRLDPGFSFRSFIIDKNDINLEEYIDNFVINYLTNEIAKESDDRYLTDFIDYDEQQFKSLSAKKLFSDRERIISVIRKIAEVEEVALEEIKQKSFTVGHYHEADKLISKLLTRLELYKEYVNYINDEEEEEYSSPYKEERREKEATDTEFEGEMRKDDKSKNTEKKRKHRIWDFDQNTSQPTQNKEIEKNKRARTEINKNEPTERQTQFSNSNQMKMKISILMIPKNERQANILAVYDVLKTLTLMHDQPKKNLLLVEELQRIVGNINYTDEENIANAIVKIKKKLAHYKESDFSGPAKDIFRIFTREDAFNFKKIRDILSENSTINEIMSSIKIGPCPGCW